MASIYKRADIYDLGFDERKWRIVSQHWEQVLENAEISTVLDCSIGTGNLTLQLAELGKKLTGSDLNPLMLKKCEEKAQKRNLDIRLFQSDFRQINENTKELYDCVMSTGNSLPYVPNNEVVQTLHKIDKLVRPGGYIYIDLRNWDKVTRDHQRFYFYPAYYADDIRIDTIQLWDYNPDGTMTFHIVYSFEKDREVIQREIFEETYFPVQREILINAFKDMDYQIIKLANFPSQCSLPVDEFDWYCILAQKQK